MKRIRPWARTVGSAAATLLLALLSAPALPQAQTARIDNTAYVTYGGNGSGGGGAVEVTSNTVTFTIAPDPTPAVIDFFAYTDPTSPGSIDFPVDGGQCRNDQGEFGPLEQLVEAASSPQASAAAVTDRYVAGQTIVVRVQDPNRNEDPSAREYIEVTITTSDGDEEVLRLQETGVDTGAFATAIRSVEIPPPPTRYDCQLSVSPFAKLTAVYVDPGFPDDTATTTADIVDIPDERLMVLQKQASVPQAGIGDFVQYQLTLTNTHDEDLHGVVVTDELPPGFAFQDGSLRVDGARAVPEVSSDGRTLRIPVGTLAAEADASIRYVLLVGPGAPAGDAINRASARGTGGTVSNLVEAAVLVREPLFTSHFTIIGRVLAGTCDQPADARVPVPGVRLFLDDGTYVPTDENGAYHFEGVRPGTHVVQLDQASLPAGLEAAPCRQDTRRAGRGHSQFVEAEGGALMRADFLLQPTAAASGEVAIALDVGSSGDTIDYEVELDVSGSAISAMRAMLMLPEGAALVPGSAMLGDVPHADPQVAGNVATFAFGDIAAGTKATLSFRTTPGTCSAAEVKAVALFEAGGEQRRTPPAERNLPCNATASPPANARQVVRFTRKAPTAEEAVSPFKKLAEKRAEAAAGEAKPSGDRDWLTGQVPGNAWLLPEGATASPTEAVVVKHVPGHVVRLRLNGKAVSGLHANGNRVNKERTVAVAMWRGIPMQDGDNLLEADIVDASGNVTETLSRTLRFSNDVVRAEFVASESVLVADGINRPVIAVRLLDSAGKPVRAGMRGAFTVAPPHMAAQETEMQQQRQLAGLEAFEPTWRVEGNDGIAYIELMPTSIAGEAVLGFDFKLGDRRSNRQEIKAWLKSTPRDWIVVGFAAGTVGHETLKGHMEALGDAGHDAGTSTDGQLSLYAKGRVRGKWMLTLAYDSDKPTDRLRRQGLLSTIDPDQFYTLYGDGTRQAYDASSADKLYLKLERDQFYAMFGDFTTGLDDGELTRYHRTLNGLKVEYQGELIEANAFAAETRQSFARDEIQGDGTSGLYRLSRRGIAINGERVRIEVRDRYHSERIVETRTLVRHIDYDIDYAAGTLFFREPVPSRDFDFNPVFIVVEYETHGNGDEFLSAGGRLGVRLLDDRLHAGMTYLHDEDVAGTTRLAGLDARYRIADATELRAEVAGSEGDGMAGETSGSAYLVELEHHGGQVDVLAYVRRQGAGFGLGQQNASERGSFKAGADLQWRITDTFALQGSAWHQEDLGSGTTRDAMHVKGEYRGVDWGAEAGLQWVRDQSVDGRVAESRLVTLGARKSFLDNRLDLTLRADVGLDGKADSVDFPTRIELGAAYALTPTFRVLVAQEFTDGEERDTSTTRVGFQAQPWAGATLTSTLNQSEISEYGPRTFGVLGLAQKFLVGERWSVDLAADGSHSIDQPGEPLVVNPEHPIAPGGTSRIGALSEDFLALSGGATYRAELWSVNGRLEHRDGERSDRIGFSTAFLRQATDGVAFAASAQAFSVEDASGMQGLLANASLGWAWRPLGSRWSVLDRLEFRLDEARRAQGEAIVADDSLAVSGDARAVRLVNNLVLNYVGDPWTEEDRRGNLFDVSQRSQLSLYYGSKYVFDTYDDEDYSGYTDILGVDWRHDLSEKFDVGLRASVRHAWSEGAVSYAFGPSVGFTPFTNAWFSLGYNVVGFDDRDFQAMHYTAQGLYLMMRFKFDQETLGLVPDDRGQGR